MKHSMLRVIKEDEIIEVTDVDALDFMVVIKGSLTLEYNTPGINDEISGIFS